MSITSKVQKYFWDIDPKKAQPKAHPEFYIKRILELGDKKSVSWLKKVYGIKEIIRVSKIAKLSPKSKNYWNQIFNFK